MAIINFANVIAYSTALCFKESNSKCATYVKKAFSAGGCKYISGNGWNNQNWCKQNGFVCIGEITQQELKDRGYNVRAHDGFNIWFPENYVQQMGDVCLIKHGKYGHICYAMSGDINDWVSDYFQRPPGQMANTGPYCYKSKYEGVQFWRHKSVLNGAQEFENNPQDVSEYVQQPGLFNNEMAFNGNSNNTVTNLEESVTANPKEVSGVLLGTHMPQRENTN